MGIGYILVVSKTEADSIIADIKSVGEDVYQIGSIVKGDGTVKLV